LRGALGRVYWKLKANFICVLAGTEKSKQNLSIDSFVACFRIFKYPFDPF